MYKLYGKAYGWISLVALCFFWASEQSTNILTSWWLSRWTAAQILYQIQHNLGVLPAQPNLPWPVALLGLVTIQSTQ